MSRNKSVPAPAGAAKSQLVDSAQRRRLAPAALYPHPLFPRLAEAVGPACDLNAEAAEIECLPSGEILGGHSRWFTLIKEKVNSTTVRMRNELVGRSPGILGLHVLRNYLREIAADDVTRVSLFSVWDRWRRSLPATERSGARRRETDGAIRELLGVSRRTLLRQRAVQTLAPDIVDDLAALKLSRGALERIACLGASRREKILAELRVVTDPRSVLATYFPNFRTQRHKKTEAALAAFARELEAGIKDLHEREHMAAQFAGPHATTLRNARRLIDILLGDAGAPGARP